MPKAPDSVERSGTGPLRRLLRWIQGVFIVLIAFGFLVGGAVAWFFTDWGTTDTSEGSRKGSLELTCDQ